MQTKTPAQPKALPQAPRPRLTRKQRKAEKRAAREAAANVQARLNARAQREAERRPTVEYLPSWELDVDAMSRRDSLDERTVDPCALVERYVDWLNASSCDDPVRRTGRAHWRKTNTCRALDLEHDRCEFGDFRCWANRPGAEAAYLACNGCVYSYPQPTGPDLSLRDAFGTLGTERAREMSEQLRGRIGSLRRRYV